MDKKIMVVEDDILNQEMMADILRERGFTVVTASDGDLGLQLLEKEPDIALVITDIFMPKKEGVGFIREVRRLDSGIKVVAITGSINFETISQTALDFGANLTIKKPFDIDEFAEKIEQLIAS